MQDNNLEFDMSKIEDFNSNDDSKLSVALSEINFLVFFLNVIFS